MDWFSWLSKTNLDPSLTYEYALVLAHNELEQADIPYFDHEFLQSVGISTAKHRLEILKLATEEKKKNHRRALIRPVSWFRIAMNHTKTYLAEKIETFVRAHRRRRRYDSHISLDPPKRNQSLRWKVAMLQRNKRVRTPLAKPIMLGNDNDDGVLTLTNWSAKGGDSRSSVSTRSSGSVESEANTESTNQWNSSFSRTPVQSEKVENRSSSTKEVKWDSMFKNLKPT